MAGLLNFRKYFGLDNCNPLSRKVIDDVDKLKSAKATLIDGKNVMLKVDRDEDFIMPSRINPWLKYSIFTLSYLFLLFAIGLVVLGVWAEKAKSGILFSLKKFDPKNVVLFLEPTILIFLIGIVIMIISFCGTVGSLRDNCFYLMLYTCLLGCMIITYLMLVIMVMLNGRVVLSIIETTIEDTIILYRDDPDLQLFVDWVQINLKCCGAFSPHDWNNNIYFSDINMLRKYKSLEAGGVPFSCCKATESTTSSLPNMYCGLDSGKHPQEISDEKGTYLREDIHQKGCVEMIKWFLINNTLYIASAAFIFLMIQLFCLFSACILQNRIFEQREDWYSTRNLKVFIYDQ